MAVMEHGGHIADESQRCDQLILWSEAHKTKNK